MVDNKDVFKEKGNRFLGIFLNYTVNYLISDRDVHDFNQKFPQIYKMNIYDLQLSNWRARSMGESTSVSHLIFHF